MTTSAVEPLFDRLPASWQSIALGEAAYLRTGGSAPQGEKYFLNGKYPFVRVQHFNGTEEYLRRWDMINEQAVKDYRLKLFPRETILFPKSGASIQLEKRTKLPFDAYVVGHLCCVEPRSIVHGDYLFFLLKLLRFAHAMDGSTLPYLNLNQLQERRIPLPPLPEQQKIAVVLGVVQHAIEQQERLLQFTTELKKTLLHQLFTQGLRGEPQKQTEIGPVPESWEVVELISVVEQIDYGISAPIPKTPPENGVKIVSTADITKDGRLLYSKIRRIEAPEKTVKRLTLRTGDVLFNWRNSAELIGKSAVFQEQDEPHVFASFILRIQCGEKKSHNFFLASLMNYYREKEVFIKLARRAVNQANYNRNEISVLKIPLPPYPEQREIADVIAAVDTKIDLHRRKHASFNVLFRTLLHQLMTAQMRVHDLDLPKLETM